MLEATTQDSNSSLSLKFLQGFMEESLEISRFFKNQSQGSMRIKLGGGLKAIPQELELSPLWISQTLALNLGVLEFPRTQGKENICKFIPWLLFLSVICALDVRVNN